MHCVVAVVAWASLACSNDDGLSAVVTLTDVKFTNCAARLIATVRGEGAYHTSLRT